MLKKLLNLILNNEEIIKEVDLDDIEQFLKSVHSKKIEYLTFKTVNVQETKNSDGSLRVIAIASTDSIDRGMDIVIPTGIKTTNIKNGMIPMLLQHDHDLIIGGWDKWYVKDNKFVVEGTFLNPQTDWQKDAFEKVKSKVLNGISIGFIIDKVGFEGEVRILQEIELLEVSIVTIPMNQDCYIVEVSEVKTADISQTETKSAESEEVQSTSEPVVSPDPDDSNPTPSEEQPVVNEEVVKLQNEITQLKEKISALESEIADYEAVIEDTAVEVEELLKAKRGLYEK